MEEFLAGWGPWIMGASVLMFFGSLWLVSWLIIRLPYDYFTTHDVTAPPESLLKFYLWGLVRNVIGACLILSGIAMLVLPGQGIITIVLGLSLMSFPGKRKIIQWILERNSIRKTMNWLRRKAKKQPLVFDLNLTLQEPESEAQT